MSSVEVGMATPPIFVSASRISHSSMLLCKHGDHLVGAPHPQPLQPVRHLIGAGGELSASTMSRTFRTACVSGVPGRPR